MSQELGAKITFFVALDETHRSSLPEDYCMLQNESLIKLNFAILIKILLR
jgi:hypothetical protein